MFEKEAVINGSITETLKTEDIYQKDSSRLFLYDVKLKPLSDGRFIRKYCGSFDIWNSVSRTLELRVNSSICIELPETKKIIYAYKRNVIIYENENKLTTLRVHETDINDIVRLNDDIFASCDHKTIKIWNLKTRRIIRTLTGHTDKITKLAATPDGFISGSRDKTVRIWNLKTNKCTVLQGDSFTVRDLFILPTDDSYLIVFGDELRFEIWKPKSDGFIFLYKTPFDYLLPYTENRVIFIEDGSVLTILDVITQEARKLSLESYVRNISLIDENRLVACLDKVIAIINLQSLEILQVLIGHTKSTVAVTYLPNGKIVSTSEKDDQIIIWSTE